MADKDDINPAQLCRIVQRQSASGFTLCDSFFTREVVVPAHSHDEAHVTLVLQGACHETYLRQTHTLEPLTVTYFHPGESHTLNVLDGNFRTFDIELNDAWLDRLLERPIAPNALLGSRNHSISRLATRLYQEFREMDEVSGLAMEGLALEILADLSRSSRQSRTKRAPRWLALAVETIRDEFARTITLPELAQSAGVHPAHLAEVFRQHYQCTPGEYLRRVRVERAIELMAEPEAALAEIALAVGFSDQSHFSRVFKRATGMTPARFRRLNFDPHPVPGARESFKTEREP